MSTSGRDSSRRATQQTGPKESATGQPDWVASILAKPGRPSELSDIKRRVRAKAGAGLTVILIDSSGSMLRNQTLAQVKGAVSALMAGLVKQREHVAVIAFRGQGAELVLPPGPASRDVSQRLKGLGGGGGTPLKQGLIKAKELLMPVRKSMRDTRLLVFTDGRSKERIEGIKIPSDIWVIDTETASVPLRRTQKLAQSLKAQYRHIRELIA